MVCSHDRRSLFLFISLPFLIARYVERENIRSNKNVDDQDQAARVDLLTN